MFERGCGATTGFTTQISILKRGEPLKGAGNVFVADDDHGAARGGEWGGPWAAMSWTSPSELVVRYASKSQIFKKIGATQDVRVVYREE